jgi:hypothetical protein
MAKHAKPGGESPETLPAATLTTVLAAVASGDQSRADTLAWAESNARLN